MPQGKFTDLTSRVFGRLRVVSRAASDRRGQSRWTCFCDPSLGGCGGTTTSLTHNLTVGNTTSCGCAVREAASRVGKLRFTKLCSTCGLPYAGTNRQKYCGRTCRPQYRRVIIPPTRPGGDAGRPVPGAVPRACPVEVPPVTDYTLPRTGDSPLTFRGDLIAEADSQARQGPAESRWYEIALYRTAGGSYVVAVGFRSRWQGEQDRNTARVFATPAEVRAYLRDYDPCDPELWAGIPPGVHDADRRNALTRSAVAGAFRGAVSRVLVGTEFAEVVA